MQKRLLYAALLLLPFLTMLLTNEIVKRNTTKKGYSSHGVTTINSAKAYKDKCSWMCHNNTNYCRANHVKYAKPYFAEIDPIYYGIIRALKATGNYGLANIVFLVVLIPLIIYVLLVKSIGMQFEIRKLKKEN